MSSSEILMEQFIEKVHGINISENFQDLIVDTYQNFLNVCPDLDPITFLSLFPNDQMIENLQPDLDNGDLQTCLEQANLYSCASLIRSGYDISAIGNVIYQLTQGIDYSFEDDHRCTELFIPFSLFLLALSGIAEATDALPKAKGTNVFSIAVKKENALDVLWTAILDALDAIQDGIEPIFVEVAENLLVEAEKELLAEEATTV